MVVAMSLQAGTRRCKNSSILTRGDTYPGLFLMQIIPCGALTGEVKSGYGKSLRRLAQCPSEG